MDDIKSGLNPKATSCTDASGSGSPLGWAAASVGEAGGGLSNTPPSNPQREFTSQPVTKCWYAGIDTIHMSYGVKWGDDFDEIIAACEAAKAERGKPEPCDLDCSVYFRGQRYEVRARGAGQGVYMPFVLESGGMVVLFNKNTEPKGEQPNLRIEVGAMACLIAGTVGNLIHSIRTTLSDFGCEVLTERVSRLDIFADVEADTAEFCKAFAERRFVTRARKTGNYGEFLDGAKPTGFTFGVGETMLRVYDKLHELKRDSGKAVMYEIHQWMEDQPDVVTRVEFQLRREALKDHGINTLDEMGKAVRKVAAHLVGRWFRLTEGTVDRKNPKRAIDAAVWSQVVQAFRDGFDREQPERTTVERNRVEVSQLAAQIIGLMTTICGIRGLVVKDFKSMYAGLGPLLERQVTEREVDVFRISRAKSKRFEAVCPVAPVTWAR